MDELSLLTITLTLLCIMDPVGNLSTVLSLIEGIDPNKQKTMLLREMFFALAFMLFFNFIGDFLLNYLELSSIAVRLSAGAILFLIAIKILFPSTNSLRNNLPKENPYLVPLAIPLIAGPSLLATIMLYANIESCKPMMISAILIAWMICSVIILSAPHLYKILGKNGLTACERLMAMLLIMLAIQRLTEGIHEFVAQRP
jgi:multiple antibiotic resistance protein